MSEKIVVPTLGESVTEATVAKWLKKKGDKVSGAIKSITDFGIFVGLEGDIDGLIHLSDISEDDDPKEALDQYKKDQKLDCIVFAIDAERERISLKLSE